MNVVAFETSSYLSVLLCSLPLFCALFLIKPYVVTNREPGLPVARRRLQTQKCLLQVAKKSRADITVKEYTGKRFSTMLAYYSLASHPMRIDFFTLRA